jgi:phospholipid/cholesterol/gamma-HCH transport system substrate-binding protein
MKQTRAVELGAGLFVLLGVGALFFLTTQTTNMSAYATAGYELVGRFDNVGGLKVRAPVTLAGVTVGRVVSITVDPEQLRAVVRMKIDPAYDRLPDDSDAAILTAGLIGGQYIGISPGGSDRYLADGDELQFTQSALVLEELIGKFLVRAGQGNTQEGETP